MNVSASGVEPAELLDRGYRGLTRPPFGGLASSRNSIITCLSSDYDKVLRLVRQEYIGKTYFGIFLI